MWQPIEFKPRETYVFEDKNSGIHSLKMFAGVEAWTRGHEPQLRPYKLQWRENEVGDVEVQRILTGLDGGAPDVIDEFISTLRASQMKVLIAEGNSHFTRAALISLISKMTCALADLQPKPPRLDQTEFKT